MFALLIGYQYRSAAVVDSEPDGGRRSRWWRSCADSPAPGCRTCGCGRGERVFDARSARSRVHRAVTGVERWGAAAWLRCRPRSAFRSQGIASTATSGLRSPDSRPKGRCLVRPDDFVGWRADKLPDRSGKPTAPSAFDDPLPR